MKSTFGQTIAARFLTLAMAGSAVLATGLATGAAGAMLTGCEPQNIADAESKGNAKWLDAQGSPEAVAALGRLADTKPEALTLIQARAKFDVNAMLAAWTAMKRTQQWGTDLLRTGLQDPSSAERASSAMARRDPLLVQFVPDLEGAVSRLAAGSSGASLGALLASVGPPAHAALVRRLADGASRSVMCSGIATVDATQDARQTLMSVPPGSRDNSECVRAVVTVAASDDAALNWLGATAEPGLLTAAANEPGFPCARIHTAWTQALANRPPEQQGALTVPLAAATKRCAQQLDGILSDALRTGNWTGLVVQGLDPYAVSTAQLTATCEQLKHVDPKPLSPVQRERIGDIEAYGCKAKQR